MMRSLVWFRNDLRVSDNPSLVAACEAGDVVAVYIWVDEYRESFPIAWRKVDLIRRQLQELKNQLADFSIPLLVVRLKAAAEIPTWLQNFSLDNQIGAVYFNNEYPWYERQRDKQVSNLLRESGVEVFRFDDRVILPPRSVRNGSGDPYKVFTPYKNKWLSLLTCYNTAPFPRPHKKVRKSPGVINCKQQVDLADDRCFGCLPNQFDASLWPVGEQYIHQLADDFIDKSIENYHVDRDFPSIKGTSKLSPYLAIGVISPRQLLAKLILKYGGVGALSQGASTWLSELIWREFYQHLLVDFPHLGRAKPMQEKTIFFPWRGETAEFEAWKSARTGIPIVDAAMKQLLSTGWMHNRLRMVVASFLTKNLIVDWRLGERFFMEHLIDGDFAANNGGWQWSASTGADAAPYFRIFNPVSQSERFDPRTEFLLEWLPELAKLPVKKRHHPNGEGYIAPIVDLKESRKETIALFAALETRFK